MTEYFDSKIVVLLEEEKITLCSHVFTTEGHTKLMKSFWQKLYNFESKIHAYINKAVNSIFKHNQKNKNEGKKVMTIRTDQSVNLIQSAGLLSSGQEAEVPHGTDRWQQHFRVSIICSEEEN